MIATVFQNKHTTDQPFYHKVTELLIRFKEEDKNGIRAMRELSQEEFKLKKLELPIVCFAGKFSRRNMKSLIKASGHMILDFDNFSDVDKLRNNQYVYSAFLSPSGKGYKALIRIPEVNTDQEYKELYYAVMDEFPEIDTSGKDISRACFFSYDPDLFINDNSLVWTKRKTDKQPINIQAKRIQGNDYGLANRVLKIIRYAIPGERHNKLLIASRLMGGYIGSGKIEFDEAKRLLESEVQTFYPDEHQVHFRTISDGLKNGIKEPIEAPEEALKNEETNIKFGKVYFTLKDKQDQIDYLFEHGVQKGYDVGFNCLAPLYSVKPGSTTYIYGAPYSGKSQLWFEFLLNLSEIYGLRHAIFSPETGRAEDIFIELIEMKAQRDFYKTHGEQMTKQEKEAAARFIDQHFIIVDPQDKPMTIEDFYNLIDIIERVYSVKVDTTTIDPYNEIRHDYSTAGGMRDVYLENMLGTIRENARVNTRHNCIITHIVDQQLQKQGDISYYPMPTFREVAGGQAWSRKGMAMIAVWRPKDGLRDEDGIPYQANETVIEIQKAKPKGIGSTGRANLYYDLRKHRYKELSIEGYSYARMPEVDYPPSWDTLGTIQTQ